MKYNRGGSFKRSLFYTPKPKEMDKPQKKSLLLRALKKLWSFFLKFCTLFGFLLITSTLISSLFFSTVMPSKPIELPPQMVLQMTLKDSLPEKPQKDPVLAAMGISRASLYEVIDALKRAKTDAQIVAFVLEIQPGSYSSAQLNELRNAILDFKTSNKPTLIYAPSYDVTATGLTSYYIASVFDEIWMQPVGNLSLSGLYAEQPFVKNALDKIGVKADVFKRKEYKTAMDNIAESNMSQENREMITDLLGDLHDNMSKSIAESRGISENIFESYVNVGLLTDEEALDANLVDRLGYGDELVTELNEKLGGTQDDMIPYISLDQYITFKTHGILSPLQIISQIAQQQLGQTTMQSGEIALIFAQGPITQYAPPNYGFDVGNTNIIAADKLAEWIYDAAFDDDVKSIVLRIDSPGGSPQASETVRRALIRAKQEGKRIVVSMGSMAASGGYWIASAADHIFATEMTITGSIGVVGAKFDLTELWSKIHVNWESVSTAENADFLSPNTTLTESGRQRYDEIIDAIYDSFLDRVAEGRNLSYSGADEVARGRVWSGIRAHENKLVDDLGGLGDALQWAAEDLGHENAAQAGISIFPSPQAGLDAILSLLGVSAHKVIRASEDISALKNFVAQSPAGSLLGETTKTFDIQALSPQVIKY